MKRNLAGKEKYPNPRRHIFFGDRRRNYQKETGRVPSHTKGRSKLQKKAKVRTFVKKEKMREFMTHYP